MMGVLFLVADQSKLNYLYFLEDNSFSFLIYIIRHFITLSGVILRPGFIHGTRRVGSMKIPLGVIGSPLEMVHSSAC